MSLPLRRQEPTFRPLLKTPRLPSVHPRPLKVPFFSPSAVNLSRPRFKVFLRIFFFLLVYVFLCVYVLCMCRCVLVCLLLYSYFFHSTWFCFLFISFHSKFTSQSLLLTFFSLCSTSHCICFRFCCSLYFHSNVVISPSASSSSSFYSLSPSS